MLLWSAIAVLVLALAGLSAIIVYDVRAKGWSNWLTTLHDWQGTLGTVAGFLSAAGALMLSTAIQSNADVSRAARASDSIGQALAYEVERLTGPMQTAYTIGQSIDLNGQGLDKACCDLLGVLNQTLVDERPVYDAVLGQTLDFGDYNLALFTRIYAFHHDFAREVATDVDSRCAANPTGEIGYVMRMMRSGFAYYQLVAEAYPTVTPLQDAVLIPPASEPAPTQ